MYREKILLLAIAGFTGGILIRSFFDPAQLGFDISYAGALFGAVFSAFFFLFWFIRKKTFFLTLAIIVCAASIGIVRFEMKDKGGIKAEWQQFIETQVIIRGIIIDEPDERENYTRLVVDSRELFDWDAKKWKAMPKEKILLTVSRYPEFSYGDIVQTRGELQRPENFEDSDLSRVGSGEFNWEAYLAKDEIYLQMFYPKTELFAENGGIFIKRWLFSLKEKYLESIGSILPEPHAAFLGGLTVGARRSMPQDLLDDFRTVGVIHIVVLSGYNVTIIARALAGVLGLFLPWVASVIAGILGIILFAILTGGAAPVVRASIMAILIYTAQATGRINRVIIALLIAGTLMIFVNPKILRFDPSFQLSFLATLGLIYLAPYFERKLQWLPKRFNIREAASATLSAQIAVTPLLLSMMGTFSIVALPVNMLVLLSVPYAMFFGFIAGMLNFISHILAFPFTWIAYVLLEYELQIVDIFSSFPFAQITIPYFPAIGAIVLYALIGWWIMKKNKIGT